MTQIIRNLNTSVIWIAGTDFQGLVKDVELPELESEIDDDGRSGLVGISPSFVGIQKPEATFTFASWSIRWAHEFTDLTKLIYVTFRGALADSRDATNVQPYVVTVAGLSMKAPMGGASPQENTEWECGLHVTAIRQTVDGTEILNYNAETNEYSVLGKDILKSTRQALGLV